MNVLPTRARRHRGGAPRRLHRPQARHGRHARRQRRRTGRSGGVCPRASTRKCGSSSTWTSAARRSGGPRPSSREREMLARLTSHYGPIAPVGEDSSAPAERFRLPDGLTFGIIASTTQPFCRTCDRARLTADGVLLLCLYAQHGTDLRRPLRAGASRETLRRSDRSRLGEPRRSRRRRAPRRARPRRVHSRQRAEARRAPGNAHARRLAPYEHGHHGAAHRADRPALPDQRTEPRPAHRAVPGD